MGEDDDLPGITGEWMRDTKTPQDDDTPVEQRFLLRLRDNPDDNAMRMVFADWLEERGRSNKARVVRLLADPPDEGTHAAHELRVASSHLEPDWLAIVSRTPIDGCPAPVQDIKFNFRCPLSWDTLTTTDAPRVRDCDRCKRQVFFCTTLHEVRAHGEARHCVAFSSALLRSEAQVAYTDQDDIMMGDIDPYPDDLGATIKTTAFTED